MCYEARDASDQPIVMKFHLSLHVGAPRCEGEGEGKTWHIPFSMDAPKSSDGRKVYDIVFSSACASKADAEFEKVLVQTAVEAIEGIEGQKPLKRRFTKLDTSQASMSEQDSAVVEPQYSVIHRGQFDWSHTLGGRETQMPSRPQFLVVEISLPGIENVSKIDLDVLPEQRLLNLSAPGYILSLRLSYPLAGEGSAKWLKSQSQLVVTIPVQPPAPPEPEPIVVEQEVEEDAEAEADSETQANGVPSPPSHHIMPLPSCKHV
jgi:hypothetical protein